MQENSEQSFESKKQEIIKGGYKRSISLQQVRNDHEIFIGQVC